MKIKVKLDFHKPKRRLKKTPVGYTWNEKVGMFLPKFNS